MKRSCYAITQPKHLISVQVHDPITDKDRQVLSFHPTNILPETHTWQMTSVMLHVCLTICL